MKRLLFAVAAAAALWSAACSSGSGTQTPPPPQGMYSLASLNGTYAFVTNGTVATTSTEASFARTGSFVANGQGAITGGVYDTNTQGLVPAQPNVITGGSYTVNADGRGTMTLDVTASGTSTTINFSIVLTSTSDGLIMDETGELSQNSSQISTGSGNFVKQNTNDFSVSTIAGTYVFDFSGLDSGLGPESIIGQFVASGGQLTSGVEDSNDNFGLGNPAGPITQAAFTADATNMSTSGRGTVVINGETFAFYIVDGTRVRFIDATANGNMLNGDATIQTSVPTSVSGLDGGFAFLVAGSSGSGGGLTRITRFTSTGGTLSAIYQDTNNAGQYILTNNVSGNITLDSANPGRGTITFMNGNNTGFTAIFYLNSATTGVLQETDEVNVGGVLTPVAVADGTILAQSGSPSSSTVTGPYAYNWSGQTLQSNNVFDEEDSLGQVTISSLNLSGAADITEFQVGISTDQNAKGSINFNGGNGTTGDGKRPTMSLTIGNNPTLSFVLYFVNPQLAFFSNNTTPNTRISAGLIKLQQ